MKKGGYRRVSGKFGYAESSTGLAGFTMVETLIVLAVTGLLFISAAAYINGKQSRAEFLTATTDLKAQIQQIINETASGYFPNTNSFTCSAGRPPTIHNGAGNGQGTNGDCVFLGKVVEFGSTDHTNMLQTYSLAGNRQVNVGGDVQEVTSLNDAYPQAVAPLNATTQLENGLSPATMKYSPTASPDVLSDTAGVAFLSKLATYNGCSGLCAGSQTLALYAIAGSKVGVDSTGTFVTQLNGNPSNYVPVDSVAICFNSATTDQHATYTIGGSSGSDQSITMEVKRGTC